MFTHIWIFYDVVFLRVDIETGLNRALNSARMASSVGSYRAGSGTVLMLVRADERPASPDPRAGTCALVPVPAQRLLGTAWIGNVKAKRIGRSGRTFHVVSTRLIGGFPAWEVWPGMEVGCAHSMVLEDGNFFRGHLSLLVQLRWRWKFGFDGSNKTG